MEVTASSLVRGIGKPLLPLVVASCLFIALTTLFFPGMMSFDSLLQYRQAVGLEELTNAHPALMAIVWRILLDIYNNPGVILVFHQSIYWASICIFAFSVSNSTFTRTAIIVVIGLWPPLAIHSVHVWKDVGMMAGFALAASALIADYKRPSIGWLLVSTVALFYAASLRHNAILPALPLMYLLTYRVACRFRTPRTIFLSGAFLLVLLGTFFSFMSIINKGVKATPQIGTVFVWDLAAISVKSNELVLPSYIQASVASTELLHSLRKTFNPNVNVPTFGTVSPYVTNVPNTTFIHDWLDTIIHHPESYLSHRVHVFSTLIGSTNAPIYYPFHEGIDPNTLGIKFATLSSDGLATANTVFRRLSATYIYRPWPYLILGTGAAIISCWHLFSRMRAREHVPNHVAAIVAVFSLSGLASVAPLFVFAPSADYRYNIWLIMSVMMMLFVASIRPKLVLRGAEDRSPTNGR